MLVILLNSVIHMIVVLRIIMALVIVMVCGPVRNVTGSPSFCVCYSTGNAYYYAATYRLGVRPIPLEMLLDLVISVDVLILLIRVILMLPLVMVCELVRNVGKSTNFCLCNNLGATNSSDANRDGGVQPSFLSTLEMLLDLLNSVIVLVMVMQFIIMLLDVVVYDPSSHYVRNVGKSTNFCFCRTFGNAASDIASYRNYGVRPC